VPAIPDCTPYRGVVEKLDERCGVAACVQCSAGVACAAACERWHRTECAAVEITPAALEQAGSNWQNFVPIAACGGRPVCPSSPFFSRASIVLPFIRAKTDAHKLAPPPIHIEIRMGDEGAVSRVARAQWTPNDWNDNGLLLVVTGVLATRIEFWAWCEALEFDNVPLLVPVETKVHFLLDRVGGPKDVWLNDLANVVVDPG
jgi:hypothetical protein